MASPVSTWPAYRPVTSNWTPSGSLQVREIMRENESKDRELVSETGHKEKERDWVKERFWGGVGVKIMMDGLG